MPSKDTADAVAMLKADHRKVEDLFARFEKAKDSASKAKLATEICTELTVHATSMRDLHQGCKVRRLPRAGPDAGPTSAVQRCGQAGNSGRSNSQPHEGFTSDAAGLFTIDGERHPFAF